MADVVAELRYWAQVCAEKAESCPFGERGAWLEVAERLTERADELDSKPGIGWAVFREPDE
jgi:hypothetical protein